MAVGCTALPPARTAGNDLVSIFGLSFLGPAMAVRIPGALATKLWEGRNVSALFSAGYEHPGTAKSM